MSAYRTFGFPAEVGTDRGGYSTLITQHFKNAVRRQMNARGYLYSEENPELLVNFYANTSPLVLTLTPNSPRISWRRGSK